MGAKDAESSSTPVSGGKGPPLSEPRFLHRVLITVGIVVLVGLVLIFVWQTIDVLLLVYAGILFGLILHTMAALVSRYTRLKHGWALLLSILVICAFLGTVSWLAVPRVSEQFNQLRERLPQAVQQLIEKFQQTTLGKYLLQRAPAGGEIAASAGKIFSSISVAFSKTLEVLIGILVIFFVSIYTAVDPGLYVNGFLQLVPKGRRPRAREVLRGLGHTLRYWMLGQLCSMALIGVLTGIGLWLLGIPLALLIGILAGILDFVPIVGTVLSAIPALLLAFLESPAKALYVVLLYTGIHQAEAHLILPLVQQRAISLPPVITIVTLVLLDRLFGFMGLFLAAPIAATVIVLVKMIYVEDVLGGGTGK